MSESSLGAFTRPIGVTQALQAYSYRCAFRGRTIRSAPVRSATGGAERRSPAARPLCSTGGVKTGPIFAVSVIRVCAWSRSAGVEIDQIVHRGRRRWRVSGRLGRHGLSGRIPLTGHIALGNGFFLDRPHGLARFAIEHVQDALLGGPATAATACLFKADIGEDGRRICPCPTEDGAPIGSATCARRSSNRRTPARRRDRCRTCPPYTAGGRFHWQIHQAALFVI